MNVQTNVNKKFVAIAGNVGVGKSSLTGCLSKHMEWEPFYEAVDENPYLADFYRDMRTWSFHSQIFFLSRRLRHHRQLVNFPGSVVQDRSVYEDAEIFARNLYQRGNMTNRDYKVYRELYEVMISFLPAPDLIIYLQASVETLLNRILHRGRDYEQDIDPAYLMQLNDLYESWVAGFSLCPVLIVPADNLDFVLHDTHLTLILEKIRAKLSGQEEVVFHKEEVSQVNGWAT